MAGLEVKLPGDVSIHGGFCSCVLSGLVQHTWAVSLRQGFDGAPHSASRCRMQVLVACKTWSQGTGLGACSARFAGNRETLHEGEKKFEHKPQAGTPYENAQRNRCGLGPAGAGSVIEAAAQVGPSACQLVFNHQDTLCNGAQERQELHRSLLACRRFQIYVHSKMMVVDDEVSPSDTLLCLWGPKRVAQQPFLLDYSGRTAVLLVCGPAGSMLQIFNIHGLNDSLQQGASRP